MSQRFLGFRLLKTPNNNITIKGCTCCYLVLLNELYRGYRCFVDFLSIYKNLSLFTDMPQIDLAIVTSRKYSIATLICTYCNHASGHIEIILASRKRCTCRSFYYMCVLNDVKKFSCLRSKSSYFSICPSCYNTFTICCKLYTRGISLLFYFRLQFDL